MTNPLPPLPRDQRKIDADHLNLLAIFHFIGAGLAGLGILFLVAHYAMMHTLMTNPDIWKNPKQPMPVRPEQLFAIMKWFYLVMGFWFVVSAILNLISGLCAGRFHHRRPQPRIGKGSVYGQRNIGHLTFVSPRRGDFSLLIW